MTHCTDLAALIAAETDPARKAELQAQFDRECPQGEATPDAGSGGGGHNPPPGG